MGRGKPILICGGAGILSAAIQLQLEKLGGVEVIAPNEAKESGLEPIGLSFQQRAEDLLITPETVKITSTDFTPPISRRERRAQNRKKP